MNNISAKIVKIRRPHYCFACEREFSKGIKMELSVNVDCGGIWTVYTCETCQILLSEFKELFINEGEFERGCVHMSYEKDEHTPEQLLKNLRLKK